MKNPLTPAGIEPATFRFVAQHLNHCATAVPQIRFGDTEHYRRTATQNNLNYYICGRGKVLNLTPLLPSRKLATGFTRYLRCFELFLKKVLLLKVVPIYTVKVHGRRMAPLILNLSARILSVQYNGPAPLPPQNNVGNH